MQLHIEDMTCGGCARSVKAALLDLDANAKVEADPVSRLVTLDTSAAVGDVQKVLAEAGFTASVK